MATKEIKNLKWFFKVFGKKRKLQNFHFTKTNARKVFSPSALRIKLLKLTIIKSATKVSDNTVQVSYPVRTCLKNFLEELTDPNPTPLSLLSQTVPAWVRIYCKGSHIRFIRHVKKNLLGDDFCFACQVFLVTSSWCCRKKVRIIIRVSNELVYFHQFSSPRRSCRHLFHWGRPLLFLRVYSFITVISMIIFPICVVVCPTWNFSNNRRFSEYFFKALSWWNRILWAWEGRDRSGRKMWSLILKCELFLCSIAFFCGSL